MAQIKCPHCGKAFTVDESEYASIVKQVRDAEFERDIEERVRLVEKNQGSAVAAAEARAREAAQADLADVRSKAASDLMSAQAKAASDLADARSAAQAESARKDALIAGLKAQLEGAKSSVESARATASNRVARSEPGSPQARAVGRSARAVIGPVTLRRRSWVSGACSPRTFLSACLWCSGRWRKAGRLGGAASPRVPSKFSRPLGGKTWMETLCKTGKAASASVTAQRTWKAPLDADLVSEVG